MNSLKLIIPAVIIFILALGGIYYLYQNTNTQLLQPGKELEASSSATPRTSTFPKGNNQSTPSTTPTVNGVSSQPSTGSDNEVVVRNEGITTLNPSNYSYVTSPVEVSGIANVTTQNVVIEVRDNNGNILGKGQALACVGLDACPFKASVVFSKSTSLNGNIVLYSPSQLDGSATFFQEIPILFQ